MTRMLASVSTLAEAEIVLAAGVDIIDLTDPVRGAPGAAAQDLIRAAVAAIGGRGSICATAGDLSMRPDLVAASVRQIAAIGVDYVQVRIFPGGDAPACIGELASLAPQVKLIALFFGDASPNLSLLPLLARSGFAGVTIDTGAEGAGCLLDQFDMLYLRGFVEDCHAAGLIAGLSGSLELPDIPRLLVLGPDLLGFRDALCGPEGRSGALDPTRVRAARGLIPAETPFPDMCDVDYRLLATHGHASAAGEDPPVDLVFVDDLVLPVFIGAYARERDAPQKVGFAVTASVMRTGRSVEDMRDVFSYDLITDGIRMLVRSGHIAFVETLAERIATMVLGHPRVTKVVVRVQKLETGSGTVGVEIERRRTAARAMDRPVAPLMAEAPSNEASGAGTKS